MGRIRAPDLSRERNDLVQPVLIMTSMTKIIDILYIN